MSQHDDFSQHLSDEEASVHEDASDTGTVHTQPKQQQQQQLVPTITTISNIKLPILKKEGKDSVVRILPSAAAEIHVVEKERKD
ncbi:hypothetical protein Tco_0789455 [Tanacetum coccineum]